MDTEQDTSYHGQTADSVQDGAQKALNSAKSAAKTGKNIHNGIKKFRDYENNRKNPNGEDSKNNSSSGDNNESPSSSPNESSNKEGSFGNGGEKKPFQNENDFGNNKDTFHSNNGGFANQRGNSSSAESVSGSANIPISQTSGASASTGAKEGAKEGGKAIGKALGEAMAGLAATIGLPALIAIIILIALFIFFLIAGTVVGANTPLALNGTAVAEGMYADEVTEEAVEAYYSTLGNMYVGYNAQASLADFQLAKYAVSTMFAKAKNWWYSVKDGVSVKNETGEEVDDADILKLREAGDYEGVLNVYREIIDQYFEKSYSDARAKVESESSGYDEYGQALTMQSFDSNVNVFSNVNYASVLAAYSVGDDYEHTSLARFKEELRKVEWCSLDIEETERTDVEPYIVYSYHDVRKTVKYMEYLEYQGDGSIAVVNAVKESLSREKEMKESSLDEKTRSRNSKIAEKTNKESEKATAEKNKADADSCLNTATYWKNIWGLAVLALAQINPDYQKTETYAKYVDYCNQVNFWTTVSNAYAKQIDDCTASINKLTSEIDALNNEINTLNEEIDTINATYKKVDDDHSEAKVSMVKYYDEYKEITLYVQDFNNDDTPVIKETLGEEYLSTGKSIPKYVEISYTGLDDAIYYEKDGMETVYPKERVTTYGEVRVSAVNTTGEYLIEAFGYEPDGIYEMSKDSPNPITNLEAYQNFYDVIAEKTDLASYVGATSGVSINTFGTVYTASQIEEMINAAGDISGNRKEILKYALSLCGRVMYQWGGLSDMLGFRPEWGTQTIDGKDIGLDCSGYTQWVVHNAMPTDNVWKFFDSTATITSNCTPINANQLKPGDLGTTQANGKHVGIFVGYDAQGNQLWAHSPQTGECVKVSVRTFNYYWRIPSANLESNNFESATYDPLNLTTVTNIDDMYVITYSLYGEARTDDGLRAVSEACNNHAISSGYTMLEQVSYPNYLDAYTRLFVKEDATFIANCPPPTSVQYEIVQDAMNGTRVFFKNGDTPKLVMYWRAQGTEINLNKYTYVKTIGGNDFYYAK